MKIELHRMRLHAFHGVLPAERIIGGDYTVDISLTLPDAPAATQYDELSGTVNYAEVAHEVKAQMAIPSQLLEHVAGRISRALLKQFPMIEEVEVCVCKLTPPIKGLQCDGASVTLQLRREV